MILVGRLLMADSVHLLRVACSLFRVPYTSHQVTLKKRGTCNQHRTGCCIAVNDGFPCHSTSVPPLQECRLSCVGTCCSCGSNSHASYKHADPVTVASSTTHGGYTTDNTSCTCWLFFANASKSQNTYGLFIVDTSKVNMLLQGLHLHHH